MRYAIVIERGETSYGAYVPDLPGCVAVGKTVTEVKTLIEELNFIWRAYGKRAYLFPNRNTPADMWRRKADMEKVAGWKLDKFS